MVKLSEYELKRGGLKFVLLIAIETLKAELTKQFFLMANFIISLVDLIIGTLAYFYLAIFIGEAMNRYITAYGMSYAEYLLIGILGNIIGGFFIHSLYEAISIGYWSSETDLYITSPIGLKGMLLGYVLLGLFWRCITIFVLVVSALMIGVPLHYQNLLQVLEVLLVGLLPFIGLGLISASTFTLINSKSGSPISWLIEILQRIFSGYYFPIQLLPPYIRLISLGLPHTYFFEALRLSVAKGYWIHQTPHLLYPLIIQSIILIPTGIILFKYSIIKAERTGDLSRWT